MILSEQLSATPGNVSFTAHIVPYLRAKTVRRLNRDRDESEPLTCPSKSQIAHEMLEALAALVPDEYAV